MKTSYFNARRFAAVTAVGVLLGIGGFLAPVVKGDWNPDDPYKMHFPQMPYPLGWDVFFGTNFLADDWLCTETGPVSDIHLWFSYRGDLVAPISGVWINISSDVPASANNPFSHPGDVLWRRTFSAAELTVRPYGTSGTGGQGWFDPRTGEYQQSDHFSYYQLNIQNIVEPFIQQANNIYWLEVLLFPDFASGAHVGWKTSTNHYNDDAVWIGHDFAGNRVFRELRDPITNESLDMAFVITVPEPGTWLLMGIGAAALGIWARSRRSRS